MVHHAGGLGGGDSSSRILKSDPCLPKPDWSGAPYESTLKSNSRETIPWVVLSLEVVEVGYHVDECG